MVHFVQDYPGRVELRLKLLVRSQVGAEDERRTAVLVDFALECEADLRRDALGCDVGRPDNRDQMINAGRCCSFSDSSRGLAGVSLALEGRSHVPPGLDEPVTLYLLHGQAAVAHEVTGVGLDHPKPEPVLVVVALCPLDPAGRSTRSADLKGRDVGEVCLGHVAKSKSRRRVRKHPHTISRAGLRPAGSSGSIRSWATRTREAKPLAHQVATRAVRGRRCLPASNTPAREDSLDRLVEWPAQREFLGDVTGLAVLDAGCGNGAKIAQLAGDGAVGSVGVDISGNFIEPPRGVELVVGDLSDLAAVPGLAGRRFDRILFLQSFGYAADGVEALRTAREMLAEDGFILLTRTQPVRYAIERAEQNGTSLGEEYFATESFDYKHHNWNDQVTLTKRPYTMSDLLNTFSAAGLWVETAVEPQMPAEAAERYPHKQAAMNKYLGILMFKLRPLPGQPRQMCRTTAKEDDR